MVWLSTTPADWLASRPTRSWLDYDRHVVDLLKEGRAHEAAKLQETVPTGGKSLGSMFQLTLDRHVADGVQNLAQIGLGLASALGRLEPRRGESLPTPHP